jgi:beta-glucosidase
MPLRRSEFGDEFSWGVASAAFQVEGAWDVDGKQPSIWDEACRVGKVTGGLKSLNAIDAFHRLDEDLDLIAALGVTANRFSINWPRVFGNGRGPWNAMGGAYYDRLIDGCLDRGIEPWVTVHHWDLPLALQREGGWLRRGIVDDFARFAEDVVRHYGDRVKHWMVMNEPLSMMGHALIGVHTRTGLHPLEALKTMHHLNLACAEGGRAMRAALPSTAEIGTTNVFLLGHPYDAVGRHRRMQRSVEALLVDAFIDPPAGLGYPFEDSQFLRPLRRYLKPGDIQAMRFEYDFMGVQYYGPIPTVKAPVLGAIPTWSVRGAEVNVRSAAGVPVHSEGLGVVLRRYQDHPACKRFVITESGFGMRDRLIGGRVRDDLRTWYSRSHLEEVRQAIADGVPVDGFFQWSYADNIEWLLGPDARFGLVHIDYEDNFRRTPKDSYYWFQRLLVDGEVD